MRLQRLERRAGACDAVSRQPTRPDFVRAVLRVLQRVEDAGQAGVELVCVRALCGVGGQAVRDEGGERGGAEGGGEGGGGCGVGWVARNHHLQAEDEGGGGAGRGRRAWVEKNEKKVATGAWIKEAGRMSRLKHQGHG